jgi:glycine cleavage system regulatory protein
LAKQSGRNGASGLKLRDDLLGIVSVTTPNAAALQIRLRLRRSVPYNSGMLKTLVMTVLSPDRPGLVEKLANTVASQGGNWLESRMCHLGGQFAGIIRVEIDADRAEAVAAAVRALPAQGITVALELEPATAAKPAGTLGLLELVGHDRPGILHQISRVLAAHKVNVEELSSERVNAPMDGTVLFKARIKVLVPPSVAMAQLRADLERIASDLMVDVTLQPAG